MWNKSRGLNFCSTIISQTFKSAIIKGPFENTTNFFFCSKLPKTSKNAKKFSDISKSFTILIALLNVRIKVVGQIFRQKQAKQLLDCKILVLCTMGQHDTLLSIQIKFALPQKYFPFNFIAPVCIVIEVWLLSHDSRTSKNSSFFSKCSKVKCINKSTCSNCQKVTFLTHTQNTTFAVYIYECYFRFYGAL